MIVVVLNVSTSTAERNTVIDRVQFVGSGLRVHTPTLLSLSGNIDRIRGLVRDLPYVRDVVGLDGAYPRAARLTSDRTTTPVHVGDATIGGAYFTVIAGPCTVENRRQLLTTAEAVRDVGADMIRGGAFKPRTSPYSFQGLGGTGLRLMAEARETTGLPIVTEILDVRDLDLVAGAVDMVQVGARNMQNYTLLQELGKLALPVLLKRGFAATVQETLLATEYLLAGGNENVVICERGIRTFESSYRFTLDIGAVTVFKERTHLPVIVDPSHAAGARDRVIPLALAAAAVGADGIIVETHPDPAAALCDGPHALPVERLPELMERLEYAAAASGRALSRGLQRPVRTGAELLSA